MSLQTKARWLTPWSSKYGFVLGASISDHLPRNYEDHYSVVADDPKVTCRGPHDRVALPEKTGGGESWSSRTSASRSRTPAMVALISARARACPVQARGPIQNAIWSRGWLRSRST